MLVGLLLSAEGLSASEKVVVPIAYRNVAKNYGIPYRILFAIGCLLYTSPSPRD